MSGTFQLPAGPEQPAADPQEGDEDEGTDDGKDEHARHGARAS
jgi:hypothetical protein